MHRSTRSLRAPKVEQVVRVCGHLTGQAGSRHVIAPALVPCFPSGGCAPADRLRPCAYGRVQPGWRALRRRIDAGSETSFICAGPDAGRSLRSLPCATVNGGGGTRSAGAAAGRWRFRWRIASHVRSAFQSMWVGTG
jgi:hypothetical protein